MNETLIDWVYKTSSPIINNLFMGKKKAKKNFFLISHFFVLFFCFLKGLDTNDGKLGFIIQL